MDFSAIVDFFTGITYGRALSLLVTFFGVTSTFAYLHQAYWIWKRKSSGDVSLFTFGYFFLGQFVFVLYGFYNNDIPVIITFIANMIGSGLVIGMTLVYRKREKIVDSV